MSDTLTTIAADLDKVAQDLDCVVHRAETNPAWEPRHIADAANRLAVQATNHVLRAFRLGVNWLGGFHPNDCPPGGWPLFNLHDHNGLLKYWTWLVCPCLREMAPDRFPAMAGKRDFPETRPLDWSPAQKRKLKALMKAIEAGDMEAVLKMQKDPDISSRPEWSETDSYNRADWLHHRTEQARDWAAACRVAAERLREREAQAPALAATRDSILYRCERIREQLLSRGADRGQVATEQGDMAPTKLHLAEREQQIGKLSKAFRRAWRSFEFAALKAGKSLDDLTGPDAHTLLKEVDFRDNPDAPTELADYKLPVFPTWDRYVRAARKALCEQKNTRRRGRSHGKSIVNQDQIEQREHEE